MRVPWAGGGAPTGKLCAREQVHLRPLSRSVTIAPRTYPRAFNPIRLCQDVIVGKGQTMPSSASCGPSRRLILGGLAALPTVSVPPITSAQAQTTSAAATPTGPGFSFAAVGDTRPMMYLPLKGGKPELTKLFVEMFGLVMPEKVAEAVVAEGCEDDLRSGHKGAGPGRHAVHD